MQIRILLLLALAGCVEPLSEGEWGGFRYFGEIRGEPPMRLLPPMTDREGNVYVLYGDTDGGEDTIVYTGSPSGDWSGGCTAHRGIEGLRGFVGRSDDRMWYWSGDALVAVDGRTGSCHELLGRDPVSLTEYAAQDGWKGLAAARASAASAASIAYVLVMRARCARTCRAPALRRTRCPGTRMAHPMGPRAAS